MHARQLCVPCSQNIIYIKTDVNKRSTAEKNRKRSKGEKPLVTYSIWWMVSFFFILATRVSSRRLYKTFVPNEQFCFSFLVLRFRFCLFFKHTKTLYRKMAERPCSKSSHTSTSYYCTLRPRFSRRGRLGVCLCTLPLSYYTFTCKAP